MQAIQSISDVYYLAAILAINGGLGRTKLVEAIGKCGSAEALYGAEEQKLIGLRLFSAKQIAKHLALAKPELPKRLKHFCEQRGVQLVTIFEEGYPKALRNIADPPILLYVMGELPKEEYAIAIVGSRECSVYGMRAATYFSQELAQRGIPIISGGARGIDSIAHEAALNVGGKTVAVLGCGIDVVYPEENGALFQRIAQKGAVITEYPPGTKPLAFNFPARNRIVVGLSQGVLVTEAGRKSGALITGHLAADEGREVYCIPGDIFLGKSIGCHDLIRKGAKLVDSVADILEDKDTWQEMQKLKHANSQSIFDFQISEEEQKAYEQQQAAAKKKSAEERAVRERQKQEAVRKCLEALTPVAQKIYACMNENKIGFDALIEKSGEDFMTVSMAVLDLQVAGLIEESGQQQYRRI